MSGPNGTLNGSGPEKPGNDNVVSLPSLAERQKMQREKNRRDPQPPLINLPVMTKCLLLAMIGVHAVLTVFLDEPARFDIYQTFGFVPARYSGDMPFSLTALIAPLSYMLLHGSWTHVAMNGLMLAAFGAGMERWMGKWRMLTFTILCGLFAVFIHFIFNMHSDDPVIGASGALSGMFAAVMVMMNKQRASLGMAQTRMLPFIILWIAITVGTGLAGMPGGANIAWETHIGGFLGGFIILRLMKIA